ncbi:GMP synthase-like protein [Daphnia magna]|uniref:GMP synthase-like protein n=1 Tax=Daphnia magna TaxID=35525 RepID=A0A164XYH3_9CRUS|nr:GMP synthase-like protein [Daphnia magna]
MLLTLGLGTQFTVLETVVTTIVDLWPHKLRGKNHKLLADSTVMFLLGLIICTNGDIVSEFFCNQAVIGARLYKFIVSTIEAGATTHTDSQLPLALHKYRFEELELELTTVLERESESDNWIYMKCTLKPDLFESTSRMASSRGLSIRIISAKEPFMEADFGKTQVLICLMVDYANMAAKEHALLNRIDIATSEEERFLLEELSIREQYVATLLSIRRCSGPRKSYSFCYEITISGNICYFRLLPGNFRDNQQKDVVAIITCFLAFNTTRLQADPTTYDSFTYKCSAFRAATSSDILGCYA